MKLYLSKTTFILYRLLLSNHLKEASLRRYYPVQVMRVNGISPSLSMHKSSTPSLKYSIFLF